MRVSCRGVGGRERIKRMQCKLVVIAREERVGRWSEGLF